MMQPDEDVGTLRRRWNAAVLQRFLRQQAQAGISTHPGGIECTAEEIRTELLPGPVPADPLRQAWVDLVTMGLVVVSPLPAGGSLWRLADLPRSEATAGIGAEA